MQPPWLALLKQWQDMRGFGLTMPFVYGALDIWPGSPISVEVPPRERLTHLLRSICDETPPGIFFRLYHCDRVRDLTLALVPSEPNHCKAIKPSTGSTPSLYVERAVIPDNMSTIDDLSNVLWSRYCLPITEGRFSSQNGSFVPFTDRDLALIKKAVARVDEDA